MDSDEIWISASSFVILCSVQACWEGCHRWRFANRVHDRNGGACELVEVLGDQVTNADLVIHQYVSDNAQLVEYPLCAKGILKVDQSPLMAEFTGEVCQYDRNPLWG